MEAVFVAFGLLLDPASILLLIGGIILGIIIGILPGLGPPIAITIALPFTFYMEPVPAIILLLAIYSAATYAGSITAIAVGIPGTGAALATVQDGHKMFKSGRGGEALGYSLIGSIIGGLFSTVCLALIAPLLATIAIKFGPREFFAIGIFGLVVVVRVAGQSMFKGLLIGAVGISFAVWGIDELNGTERFTFGSYHFYEGMPFVPFLVGVFAISELLLNAEKNLPIPKFDKSSLRATFPPLRVLGRLRGLLVRSSIIGTIIGIIPGEGAAVGAFFSYAEAKRNAKEPEKFGTGIPEGVVAPETANNATIGGALVPTLTLGVPGSPAAAVLLGAFLIQGLAPGPRLFADRPDIMYALFLGLFIINILMLFLGLMAIRFAAYVVAVPNHIIVPTVMLLCFVGTFSVSNDLFGVGVMIASGVFGYLIRKLNFPIAPLSIGFVLGHMIEFSLRQSIVVSDGNIFKFFATPISASIYGVLIVTLLAGPVAKWARSRAKAEDS